MTNDSSSCEATLLCPELLRKSASGLILNAPKIGWTVAFVAPDRISNQDEATRNSRVKFWRSAADSWLFTYRTGSDLDNDLLNLTLGVGDHVRKSGDETDPRKPELPDLNDEAPDALAESLRLTCSSGKGKEATHSFTYNDLINSVLSEVATAATRDGQLVSDCPAGETLQICKPGEFQDMVSQAKSDHSSRFLVVVPASEPLLDTTTETGEANGDSDDDILAVFETPLTRLDGNITPLNYERF